MLLIHDIPELYPLIVELENLSAGVKKYATKQRDDFCFVAGTMIETRLGPRPIESLCLGDSVLTSKGFYPISGLGCRDTDLVKVEFTDGNSFVCTKDHPIFVFSGWKKASLLTQSDTVFKFDRWEKEFALNLTGSNFVDTPNQNKRLIKNTIALVETILNVASSTFTKRFGNFIMGASQVDMLSTTKMRIQKIISSLTWLQLNTSSMFQDICESIFLETKIAQNGRSGLARCEPGLSNGINLLKVQNFISGSEKCLGARGEFLRRNVSFVKQNIRHRLAGRNFVLEHAKCGLLGHAVGVKAVRPYGTGTVYNLKVQQVPEFFANSILVHNCDSLRYCIASIPWDFTAVVQGVDMQLIAAPEKREVDERRSFVLGDDVELGEGLLEADISFWQEYIEA